MVGVALLIGPRLIEGGGTALGVLAMVGVMLGYTIGNLYARIVPAASGDPRQAGARAAGGVRRRRPGADARRLGLARFSPR